MSTLPTNGTNTENDKPVVKKRCNGGCGFWGSPDLLDYCSVCFKKCVPEEQRIEATKKIEEKKNKIKSSSENKSSNINSNNNKPQRKKQKKRNRCFECRKKMTLGGTFECKCGYTFCGVHRYADSHNCDYNYTQDHQNKLKKQMNKVAPSKFEKI